MRVAIIGRTRTDIFIFTRATVGLAQVSAKSRARGWRAGRGEGGDHAMGKPLRASRVGLGFRLELAVTVKHELVILNQPFWCFWYSIIIVLFTDFLNF